MVNRFQSALPLRGATTAKSVRPCRDSYFNPRSPCGERHNKLFASTCLYNFNPRSPCGERHTCLRKCSRYPVDFNPRSPCGERRASTYAVAWTTKFQSALPLRGATNQRKAVVDLDLFQSALPLRGATREIGSTVPGFLFQSALPLRGATWDYAGSTLCATKFQSALPLRGATSASRRTTSGR